jgi:menaquinone-specific isochorismate synthase
MITYFRTNTIYRFNDLKQKLRDLIVHLPQSVSAIGTPLQILRYEFICEPMDVLNWIHNQNTFQKIYWSDRDKNFEMAGIYSARELILSDDLSLSEIVRTMEDHFSADNPYLRYYGGLCFDPENLGEEWQLFSKARFVIPQFELCHREGEMFFAFNIAIKDIVEENIPEILTRFDSIDFSTTTTYRKVPQILSREDIPEKSKWEEIFSEIKNDPFLEKIVLARRSNFSFDVSIRPSALIKHLKEKTPSCYHYCFQWDEYLGFLGASPERLYKRNGLSFLTEALAGTTKRGGTQAEDTALAQQLLNSSKNISEHHFVVQAIEQSLSKLCESFVADEQPSILKLKEAQHLITRFEGTLRKNISDDQIIESLHPTPALAGHPTQKALETIRAKEPLKRGWYGGAVGYFGYNHAEWAVAIRCGLVNKNLLSLYAGAGIVKESQWEDEWEEIENKISRFMKVFEQ